MVAKEHARHQVGLSLDIDLKGCQSKAVGRPLLSVHSKPVQEHAAPTCPPDALRPCDHMGALITCHSDSSAVIWSLPTRQSPIQGPQSARNGCACDTDISPAFEHHTSRILEMCFKNWPYVVPVGFEASAWCPYLYTHLCLSSLPYMCTHRVFVYLNFA